MLVFESPMPCVGRGSQCCSLWNSQALRCRPHPGALQEEEGEEGDGGAGDAQYQAPLDQDGL